jgi:hypothetical protein
MAEMSTEEWVMNSWTPAAKNHRVADSVVFSPTKRKKSAKFIAIMKSITP